MTGSELDKNRTWRMTRYIPEIADYLKAYEILINEIRYSIQDYAPTGINGALLSDFDKAMQFIENRQKRPEPVADTLKNPRLCCRKLLVPVNINRIECKILL